MNHVFDLDGTLLNYHARGDEKFITSVNTGLLQRLVDQGVKEIRIATNQGGLLFGDGVNQYPTVSFFFARLATIHRAAADAGITVRDVHASIFHPKGTLELIEKVWQEMDVVDNLPYRLFVYGHPESRKPSPAMLLTAQAGIYYGDSPEDEQAAQAAGIPFISVTRFT